MAGRSWLRILRKRENFRTAFRGFEPTVVARFGARDAARLLADAGIVRNRAKIDATINNARRYADLVDEFGRLAAYVCSYAPNPRRGVGENEELMRDSTTAESVAKRKDRRRRGWEFAGPATIHSFTQAKGLVNYNVRR